MVSDWFRCLERFCSGVSIRFKVRGGFRPFAQSLALRAEVFQSALRFAVVSDFPPLPLYAAVVMFQSALRFAVVSDGGRFRLPPPTERREPLFQSALRFAVVSDMRTVAGGAQSHGFQSTLRFAVVSDCLLPRRSGAEVRCFNPL